VRIELTLAVPVAPLERRVAIDRVFITARLKCKSEVGDECAANRMFGGPEFLIAELPIQIREPNVLLDRNRRETSHNQLAISSARTWTLS